MKQPCPITLTQSGLYSVCIRLNGSTAHFGFYSTLEDAKITLGRNLRRLELSILDYESYVEE